MEILKNTSLRSLVVKAIFKEFEKDPRPFPVLVLVIQLRALKLLKSCQATQATRKAFVSRRAR